MKAILIILYFIIFSTFYISCSSIKIISEEENQPFLSKVEINNTFFIEIDGTLPEDSKFIKKIKFNKLPFQKPCSYKDVREECEKLAKELGANIIKIENETFSLGRTECYSINASLYHTDNESAINELNPPIDVTNIYILPSDSIQHIPIIELYASDSININRSYLLKSIVLSPEYKNRNYEDLKRKAIDSLVREGGNLLKICTLTEESVMRAEIYTVDNETYQRTKPQIDYFNNKHEVWLSSRNWLTKILPDDNIKYGYIPNKKDSPTYSISRDSTTKHRVELGAYGGSDLVLVGINLHGNVDIHLVNKSFLKLSMSNKFGLMALPFGNYALWYYSPGAKLSVPIKNVWLSASYGTEYDYFFGAIGSVPPFQQVDRRIDFGLKFYNTPRRTFEVYYPLRLDKEIISWYTGGLVVGFNWII